MSDREEKVHRQESASDLQSVSTHAPREVEKTDLENAARPPESERFQSPILDRPSRKLLILLALCLATFLNALDVTIVTTALPTISEYFQSVAGYTWIGSTYLLAVAATTIIWGKASDVFGRKVVLLVANLVFFVGSLIAALSVNMTMLLVARAIQGAGGGGLNVLVNICIADLFSPRDRGAYYGMISGVWALAMSLGPIIGGALTQRVSWRWCFYINLPFDGVAFIVILLFLNLENPRTPLWDGVKAIDWLGALLSIGGTLMFLLGLSCGGATYPWSSPIVICTIIFGLVAWALCFAWDAMVAKYPLLSIRIFQHRANLALLGVCFAQSFVYIAAPYYLPLYFQAVLDKTPILSGVYLLPLAIALSAAAIGTGFYLRKTGSCGPPMYAGFVLQTLGYGLFINLGPTRNLAKIILYQGIAGLGVGPNFQAPMIALQSNVGQSDMASATSTFAFTRNIAGSLGIVLGQVVVQNCMSRAQPALTAVLGPELAAQVGSGDISASTQTIQHLPDYQKSIVHDALTNALSKMWILYTAVSAFGLLFCLFSRTATLSHAHSSAVVGLKPRQESQGESIKEPTE